MHAVGAQPAIDRREVEERPHEQRRPDEQRAGEGDLGDEQHARQRARRARFGARAFRPPERRPRIRARADPRRQDAGGERRDEPGRHRHDERARVEIDRVQRPQQERLRQEGARQRDERPRQSRTQARAAHAEEAVLDRTPAAAAARATRRARRTCGTRAAARSAARAAGCRRSRTAPGRRDRRRRPGAGRRADRTKPGDAPDSGRGVACMSAVSAGSAARAASVAMRIASSRRNARRPAGRRPAADSSDNAGGGAEKSSGFHTTVFHSGKRNSRGITPTTSRDAPSIVTRRPTRFGFGAERRVPQVFRQQDSIVAARASFRGIEDAAANRPHAEHREHARRDARAGPYDRADARLDDRRRGRGPFGGVEGPTAAPRLQDRPAPRCTCPPFLVNIETRVSGRHP